MTSSVLLIHHAARRGHGHPANSLRALQACLAAGARVIEVDIFPLADRDFALLHGPNLEDETDGSGPVGECTANKVRALRYVYKGVETDESVGLLSHALEILGEHARPLELHLDLKAYSPLSEAILARLGAMLQPVRERVRVSSVADWAVRWLRTLDPELPVGFDPLLYLDVGARDVEDLGRPPFHPGKFGYGDDHPLASRRWGETADYLAARAEALCVQVPHGAIWYIAARLLNRTLDDGFDWIAYLHGRGSQVAAWTLDAGQPDHVAVARRLVDRGVDRIITNDAPALAEVLDARVTH
jgi:glycerophosphoryl diester phosphodiesterase